MKPGIWYDVAENQPTTKGYYLAFKGMSIVGDEIKTDYYYWDPALSEWRDHASRGMGHTANVVYWTDADPAAWYDNYDRRARRKWSAAEQDAWNAVLRAVEQYEIVRNLAKV